MYYPKCHYFIFLFLLITIPFLILVIQVVGLDYKDFEEWHLSSYIAKYQVHCYHYPNQL